MPRTTAAVLIAAAVLALAPAPRADKDTNGLEALLVSLLSWTNVGFLAMARHG